VYNGQDRTIPEILKVGETMKVSEAKPHSIHLRLTEEQYQHCKNNSELMGVGISDYIRMIVNAVSVVSDRMKDVKLGDLKHEDIKNDIEHIL
jgi:hypothetical protein